MLALTREQGDPAKVAQALHYLANPLFQLGEFDRAEAMLVEGLAINRAAEDKTAEMIDPDQPGRSQVLPGPLRRGAGD